MNTRRAISGLLLVSAISLSVARATGPGPSSRLANVKKIYVRAVDDGSYDAVAGARTALADSGCYEIADSEKSADAVLEIASDREGSWIRLPFGGQRISASAALLDRKTGTALWTDDRSSRWLVSSTIAGRTVAGDLIRDGCETQDSDWEPFQNLKTAKATSASDAGKQSSNDAQAHARPAAAAASHQGDIKVISRGMTLAQVEAVMGPPLTRANLGEKVLYKYPDLTVEFHNGKVTDVR